MNIFSSSKDKQKGDQRKLSMA